MDICKTDFSSSSELGEVQGAYFLAMKLNTSLDPIDRSLFFSLLVHDIALDHINIKTHDTYELPVI